MIKKEEMIRSSNVVKTIYKTADNPIFEVFYIEPEIILRSTLDGKPPEKYDFSSVR